MRKDIDVLELRQAIGNIMMLDVLEDGFDARYRVYGTGVVEYVGHDWTGGLFWNCAEKPERRSLCSIGLVTSLFIARDGRSTRKACRLAGLRRKPGGV